MTGADRSVLGVPVQLAYGVTDLRRTAARFSASTGAGPFLVVEHIPLSRARVAGGPGEFDHSSAYGQWGPLMVELVEEHTPPLMTPGTGLHHVAFMVASLPGAADWCERRGWPELLHAETATGQEFVFRDARAELGHLVELYEPSDRLTGFYRHIASLAEGWDGTDPVRTTG